MVQTRLADLYGLYDLYESNGIDIGPKTLDVFRRSNLMTIEHVCTTKDDDFLAKITDAIAQSCPAGERPTDLKWKRLAERCQGVRRKLKNPGAQPVDPERLCCPLSWTLFVDPVITPGGLSFSKECITAHLRSNGNMCPVTRTPLKADQLIPNYALGSVVEYYLDNYLRFSSCMRDGNYS